MSRRLDLTDWIILGIIALVVLVILVDLWMLMTMIMHRMGVCP